MLGGLHQGDVKVRLLSSACELRRFTREITRQGEGKVLHKRTNSSQIPSKLKMEFTSGMSSLLEPASAIATSGSKERKRERTEGGIEGRMRRQESVAV
jgi:hypothetical protein